MFYWSCSTRILRVHRYHVRCQRNQQPRTS